MQHTHEIYGNKNSIICCQEINSGLFSVALESKKVGAIINGLDDLNDFQGEFHGIKLMNARVSGSLAPPPASASALPAALSRGARIINVSSGGSIESFIINSNLQI